MIERSEITDPMALELEDWPLEPDQIVAGDPQVSGRVLGDRTTWTVHEDLRKVYVSPP